MPSLQEFGRKRPDACAALALFLLPFILLGRALWPGYVLSPADGLLTAPPWSGLAPGFAPANPELTDVTLALHPFFIYAGGEIARGHFPLWNPHAFAGAPFFANPNTALLFPLTALGYVLPAPLAITLGTILKLSIAGVGMYWFLRGLAIVPPAAATGALAFMLCGPLIVWLQFTVGTPIIFLPLLLGAVERLRASATRGWIAALAALVALDIFAGYPQGAFLGLLVATAWALCRAPWAGQGAAFLLRYASAVALGVGLAAVQILPFLEYLKESAVLAYRAQWLPLLTLPVRAALTFVVPYYYGSPTGRDFWGDWNFNEITASVGVIPLIVLPLALTAGWRRAGTRFFLALAAVAAAMLYGVPILSPALAAVPGLSLVVNLRLAPLVAFALCALCGIGLDALASGEAARSAWVAPAVRAWFVLVTAVTFLALRDDYASFMRFPLRISPFVQYTGALVLLALGTVCVLEWHRRGQAGGHFVVPLLAIELLSLAPLALTYNPVIETRWLYPVPPAVRHLERRSATDPGRVLLEANVPMLWGLHDVAGYDGLTPRRIERLLRPGGAVNLQSLTGNSYIGPSAVLGSPLLDLFGVRRIVLPPDLTLPAPRFALEYEGPDARVYRNERALPRVLLLGRARCVDDAEAARLVSRAAIDFSQEVVLTDCVTPERAGPMPAGAAEIRAETPERVTIHASSSVPAYLLLTDTWFPGWRVSVDGIEQPLLRADSAFRAVWLDRGPHEIEFRYQPRSLRWGIGLSALAAVLVAALLFLGGRVAVTTVAVLALTLLAHPAAQAALPRAPLDFSVSPATLHTDERAVMRLDPRGAPREGGRFDVYVVWFVSGRVVFLTPAGDWSAQPVAYRGGLAPERLAPIVWEWQPPPRTVGTLPLGAVFVREGGQPLARTDWRYAPVLRLVRLKASMGGLSGERAFAVLGSLGLLTLGAWALVLCYPRRRSGGDEHAKAAGAPGG